MGFHRKRRCLSFLVVGGVLLGFVQLMLLRNFMVIAPGVAIDLSELVKVNGGRRDAGGSFLMTAVTSERANIVNASYALASSDVEIVPIARELPAGLDMDQYLGILTRMMEESQMVAKAVALRRLGYDVPAENRVVVERVLQGSPANGLLQGGDTILAVDGVRVQTAEDTVRRIRDRRVGAPVALKLLRGSRELQVQIRSVRLGRDGQIPGIKVIVGPRHRYSFPVAIDISAGQIKGSSAGLMFSLEILNQLVREDITRGKKIAGTGALSPDGSVDEIGGVRQKIVAAEQAGAEVFFVPSRNAAEAMQAAKRLKVVAISNIDDAMVALGKL